MTSSLYSNTVREYIRTRNWPSGLVYEVREDEHCLRLMLFRDNYNSFDGEDRLQIAMMVKEVIENIRRSGIPMYLGVERSVRR